MSSHKKLTDYTQRGKILNREYASHVDQSCSISCSSEPAPTLFSSCTSTQRELQSMAKSSGSLKSTLELLAQANKTSNAGESIDFMFKIPSRLDRRERSDLRERFTKGRSFKRCNAIESTLSDPSSRRRLRRARASF